jgi:MFS family permease
VILADPSHLGANIGRLLAADVGGFALGPAISAVLVGTFGIPAPFLVIAAVTVLCVPLIVNVRVDESARGVGEHARFAFDLLRSRPYLGAVCLGAAVFLMIGTFDALWVLVLDDLRTADWIANLGITLFALPLVVLGPRGGRLSQRVGPFKVATVGLLLGAGFMFSYGLWPNGIVMFAAAMVHSVSDGTTVSASGVAVGLVAPADRQAGAQGMLGGAQTLVGGMSALLAGQLYEHDGRRTAYAVCAVLMVALVVVGRWCARGSSAVRGSTTPLLEPLTI